MLKITKKILSMLLTQKRLQFLLLSDIDECLVPAICDPNAACNNVYLGYNCVCNMGYREMSGACQGGTLIIHQNFRLDNAISNIFAVLRVAMFCIIDLC